MNTALVTGASGFIGGHLVERLRAQAIRTRCLVRSTSPRERLEGLGAELIAGDVTEPETLRDAVAGVDVVFHMAGLTCALRRSDLFRVNAEGPANLAAACSAQPQPPILVIVSSLAAAGPSCHDALRTEDDAPRPVSQYGQSKLAGETAAQKFAGSVPTTIVRPGVVFGEYDPGMAMVAKSIRQFGIHLNAGFRSPRLSVIHARDLVEILLLAAQRGERLPVASQPGKLAGRGIYFAARPDYPTYLELGRLMAPELLRNGNRPRNLYVPGPMAFLLAAVNEGICWARGKADIFNRDKVREGLVTSWACSSEKVTRQLGWQPSAPLVDQLRATARWYCKQGWV